jgi:hypothetical protein
MDVLDLVLGRRLANREFARRKIGAFEGVPAMGLDGISSSSYGRRTFSTKGTSMSDSKNRQWILDARPAGQLTGKEFRWAARLAARHANSLTPQ